MFGKGKNDEARYIVAVKNYNETLKSLKEGDISFPYSRDIYLKLLETQSMKVDNLRELKKFIKANKKVVKEVIHYWEGLITEGYTLVNVEYNEKTPAIDHLCSNDTIKFVCQV